MTMTDLNTLKPERDARSNRLVLFISHDTVGNLMAGPGIRYSNMAYVLARRVNVVFAIPSESPEWHLPPNRILDASPNSFTVVRYQHKDWQSVESLVRAANVVICSPDTLTGFPELAKAAACLAFDDYDPMLSEWLAAASLSDAVWQPIGWRHRMHTITPHFLCGDFFICASERQRDWLIGCLEMMGRLNPITYADDPSFRRLVDVAPTGIPDHAPIHSRKVIKDVWPGIGMQDRVVLWGGGLWPWLDPLTAIRAVSQVCRQRHDVKLLFPGTRLPNPNMSGTLTLLEPARALARDLALLDTNVFFGDWVPYKDWPSLLLESDVALTLHIEVLETRLAFRSRTLDYIWAGLPTIATRGDATSELIERYGLGVLVESRDVDGVAGALAKLLDAPRPLPTARMEQARRDLNWETAMRPLIEFCLHPRRAPDREAMGIRIGSPYYVDQKAALIQQFEQDLASRVKDICQELAAQSEESEQRLGQGDQNYERALADQAAHFGRQLASHDEQYHLRLAANEQYQTQALNAQAELFVLEKSKILQELEDSTSLVNRYAQGKFIRFMRRMSVLNKYFQALGNRAAVKRR